MFRWLKLFFKDEEQEEIHVRYKLPDGRIFDATCIKPLEYKKQLLCKLHQSYSGATEPINDCKVCWEIYDKKKNG